MHTDRYASVLTLIVIALLITIGIVGHYAIDARLRAQEAETLVEQHLAERRAIGRFDTLCMAASGKLVMTLSDERTTGYDLACMREGKAVFASNSGQLQ